MGGNIFKSMICSFDTKQDKKDKHKITLQVELGIQTSVTWHEDVRFVTK
jgi:hypothetical protein